MDIFVLSRVVCVPSSSWFVHKAEKTALLPPFSTASHEIYFLSSWHKKKDGTEINFSDLHR